MRVSSSAPALSPIPANWAKTSDFEYAFPNHARLNVREQNEFWAIWLLQQLIDYVHVEPSDSVIVDEDGCAYIEVKAVLPISLFNRLADFDADGDADIETQCEDEGGASEDEGAQCDDEGASNPDLEPDDNGIADDGGLCDVYARAGGIGGCAA